MISINVLLLILAIHFIADFIFQTSNQAKNKSSSNKALLEHTFIYSICFLPFFGLAFVVITMILHTITDYISSRITKKLWERKEVHNFFVIIGLDQLLHTVALIYTYKVLYIQI